MKVVMGLGNPGTEYDATRHNVGWWVLDRLAHDRRFDTFGREGPALVTHGSVEGEETTLVKPLTYVNRSGAALRSFLGREGFDVSRDLLVVVDDAALDVGRVRFRPRGSAGGHNGLRSLEQTLGDGEFARLRIGVGRPPGGEALKDWVLSAPSPDDEEVIVGLLPEVAEGVGVWARDGVEAAMNQFNR